jgi:hypothetical protein
MKSRFFIIGHLIFFLTLFPLHVRPQQIELTSSEKDVNYGTTDIHKIIGHDEGHFYVIKYFGNQYHLEKLDSELSLLLEAPIKLNEGLRTYNLETVVHFHNNLYVFVSRRGLSDIKLYYQKIDKSTLEPVSGLIELATIDFIKGNWADFHFALSRHETKLLIVCRTKLLWSGSQFNEFYVLGEDLTTIWYRKDSYAYSGQGPRDNKYVVDEDGNVGILSLIQRESILSLIRDNRNTYMIYRYTHNGEDFNQYPVTLGERYIRGVKIVAGEQGDLICAGLYSEIYKKGMRGTFFFKIDPLTGQIYDNYLHEFDPALLSELEQLKEPKLQEEEVIEYVITDIVLRANGKMILIAEQMFAQSFNTYNNLIITCYDTNGQVYWSRVIDKRQNFNINTLPADVYDIGDYRDYIIETGSLEQRYDKNYCSYALMAPLDESYIILFYNDDVRNLTDTEKKRSFKRPKKSYLLAVAIDEFGNISKQPLIEWSKGLLFPEPLRYYDNLHTTLVIPAFRYRNFNYYKITASF